MGKRTNFARHQNDYYPTHDPRPVQALLPHLSPNSRFVEPFAGDGALRDRLSAAGHECVWASDINPQTSGVVCASIEVLSDLPAADYIITNSPWPSPRQRGEPAISFIYQCVAIAPSWMIFAADMMHNVYFADIAHLCRKIVSVGRVSWMNNGKGGYENAAWYLFDDQPKCGIRFHARPVSVKKKRGAK